MAIAKNPKVIMTERQFVERLLNIRNRKTFYKNKYPYNLCYINKDGRTSADCVNLVKAILNGYNIYNNTIGYYQKDLSNTGDCTEAELIGQCSEVSVDFSKLGTHPEILYMKGHIGVYLGKEIDGKYNVVECTKSFGGGVVYSYVDADGIRRKEKGAVKNSKWISHGKPSKWVEAEKEEPKPVQNVYYVKKGDTLSSIAKKNGMSLAKLVSYNPQIKDINKINIGDKIYLTSNTSEEYYTVQKGDTLGAIARKHNIALNKLLGLNPDIKNINLIHIGQKIRVK
jgi:LysM repeat protein